MPSVVWNWESWLRPAPADPLAPCEVSSPATCTFWMEQPGKAPQHRGGRAAFGFGGTSAGFGPVWASPGLCVTGSGHGPAGAGL